MLWPSLPAAPALAWTRVAGGGAGSLPLSLPLSCATRGVERSATSTSVTRASLALWAGVLRNYTLNWLVPARAYGRVRLLLGYEHQQAHAFRARLHFRGQRPGLHAPAGQRADNVAGPGAARGHGIAG